MPTTVNHLSYNPPVTGALITPVHAQTIEPGGLTMVGKSIWWNGTGENHAGFITIREARQSDVHGTWGRYVTTVDVDQPILFSGDAKVVAFDLPVHHKAGTFVDVELRFADLADQDDTGIDLTINGKHIHMAQQHDAQVDSFIVHTDAQKVHVVVDSGERNDPDGWALLAGCVTHDHFAFG
jgi:hypothetical protein